MLPSWSMAQVGPISPSVDNFVLNGTYGVFYVYNNGSYAWFTLNDATPPVTITGVNAFVSEGTSDDTSWFSAEMSGGRLLVCIQPQTESPSLIRTAFIYLTDAKGQSFNVTIPQNPYARPN